MNAKQKEQLRKSLNGLFYDALIEGKENKIDIWFNPKKENQSVLKLDNFLRQNFSEFFSPSFIVIIVRDIFQDFIDEYELHFENGKVPFYKSINKNQKKELIEKIISFLETLPRDYLFKIPLPSTFNLPFERYNISPSISIVQLNNKKILQDYQRPFSSIEPLNKFFESDSIFLEIKHKGYIYETLKTPTQEELISILKQFLSLSIIQGFFRIGGFFETLLKPSFQSLVFPFDIQNDFSPMARFTIDNNIRNLLGKLIYTGTHKNIKKDLDSLKEKIGIIFSEPEIEGAETIRAGAEWAFDSKTTENSTFEFIQICIGLEAILGINLSENLTRSLADRCSYLLGKSFQDRRKIYDSFTELYSERSKIVHGKKSKLSPNQQDVLEWGRNILDSVIKTELNNFSTYNNAINPTFTRDGEFRV